MFLSKSTIQNSKLKIGFADNSKLKTQNSKLILPLFTPVFLSFYPFLRHNFLGYFVFL